MANANQIQAYELYQNAVTEGTRQMLHTPAVLSQDFVSTMLEWDPIDPENVDISDVSNVSFAKQEFYRATMSETFHVHWGNYTPPAQGPGSTLLIDIRQHEGGYPATSSQASPPAQGAGGYRLTHRGFTETQEYFLEQPKIHVNSNSLTLEEGVVQVAVKQLRSQQVNGVRVWNYQLVVNGRVRANYYMVPFTLAN